MDAELVLDGMAAHVVARAVGKELRHEEERDAARAGGRIGQARQHEMHDVVGEIVLAVGDEDFLAGDAVGAVACALGAGADRGEIRARLRLGEVHGRRPFAGDELVEIAAPQFVGAMPDQRLDGAHGQDRADAEGHGGGVPHLDAGRVEQRRQALPAVVNRTWERVPSGFRPGTVSVLPARRGGHGAVLQGRAMPVALGVERSDHVVGEAARLLEDRLRQIGREVAIEPIRRSPVEARHMPHGEDDILDRRAVGHRRFLSNMRLFMLTRVLAPLNPPGKGKSRKSRSRKGIPRGKE